MKAETVTKLAQDILEFLRPVPDGSLKIAALRSAAAILENVQSVECQQQMLAAYFTNIFKKP